MEDDSERQPMNYDSGVVGGGGDGAEAATVRGALFCTACCILVIASILPGITLGYAARYKSVIACPGPRKEDATPIPIPGPVWTPPPNATWAPTPPANVPALYGPPEGLAASLGLQKWMVVHGAVGLTFAFVIPLALIVPVCAGKSPDDAVKAVMVVNCLLVPLMLFRFCWIIVGAVLFWRDCSRCEPKPVKNLMWAVLILDLLGLLSALNQRRKGQSRE